MSARRCAAALVCLTFLAPSASGGSTPLEDGGEPSALEIIQSAFDRMFNYPSVRTVTFRIHRAGGRVIERELDIVYKRVDGRGHTLVRFTNPDYLRDTAMLIIERPSGTNDTWLYRPSDRRARRVGTAQRADSFFGSDFTFEDLEHHDWRSYGLRRLPDEALQGRRCHVIEATPRGSSQYRRITAWIEREHRLLLRVDFFQGDGTTASKTLTLDAGEIEVDGGLVKPTRMWLRQNGRDQATEVLFERIETDLEITDRVFTLTRLEQSGKSLYDLVDRMSPESGERE